MTEPAVVIVSGLSGGGKTAAAKLFEDLGYTVVDNLPGELLPDLAELVSADRARFARVAIVLDVRAGDATTALAAMRGALEGRGIRPRVVFLEASDDVLIRRFSETRHRHPLGDERGIASSIAEERRRLDAVRADSDVVLDTSDLSLRQLRERLFAALATDVRADQLAFQLISFGYKFGVPLEAGPGVRRPVHAEPVLRGRAAPAVGPDRRGPRVRPGPAGRPAVPRVHARVPGVRDPGLHRRGQDPADDRHRLHRWLPPLDRDRRGAGRLAARAGLRARSRSSIGSSIGREPAPLAAPGIGIKRWLLVVFAGLLLLALAFAHFLRQITRDLAPGGPAGGIIDLLTLQFLPFALRGLIAGSVGVALVAAGAYRTVGR